MKLGLIFGDYDMACTSCTAKDKEDCNVRIGVNHAADGARNASSQGEGFNKNGAWMPLKPDKCSSQ